MDTTNIICPAFRKDFNRKFKLEIDGKFCGLSRIVEQFGVHGWRLFLCKFDKLINRTPAYIAAHSLGIYTMRLKGHNIRMRLW